jgi:ribosomal protein S12 methylthiotransferase accessory factor
MCQIELALAVVQAKLRERGEAALNAKDHSHLRRAREIDAEGCVLLQPVPLETEHLVIDSTDPKAALEAIVRRLGELGIESYGLDLTRAQFDIPVARIIVPALQIEPSGLVSARLSSIIEKTGGGEAHTGGISLI